MEATYLTAGEIAKRFKISPRHLRRMVDGGKFPQGLKLGRIYRWPLAAIERWERDGCPRVSRSR